MSAPQPIQTTAAIVHLRRSAEGLCSRHRGNPEQMPEWLAADLIEWQQRRIHALTSALIEARAVVQVDRDALVEGSTALGVLDADVTEIVTEYDGILARIDRAMEVEK